MAKLGFINFTDLSLVLWRSASHFLPMQNYILGYIKAVYQALFSTGVISGCKIEVLSGLTIRVTEGLVLFPNGELAIVLQQDITLSAADATNPRVDRIELVYSLENNATVIDTVNATKQFDKVVTATVTPSVGTPASSPSTPAANASNISLGTVAVAANQTSLASTDVIQSESVRIDSRNPLDPKEISVPTSTTGFEAIQDLVASKDRFKEVRFHYLLNRKTDTASSGKVVSGTIFCMKNPETGDWDYSDQRAGNDSVDIGVTFQVDASSGQVEWEVDAISGSNHVGELIVRPEYVAA